ncbi:MAG: hypothetical protein AAFN17_13820, partial [Pseudomonadota bacterium]
MTLETLSDPVDLAETRARIRARYGAAEEAVVRELATGLRLSPEDRAQIAAAGARMVERVRSDTTPSMMESFLAEYGLSSD